MSQIKELSVFSQKKCKIREWNSFSDTCYYHVDSSSSPEQNELWEVWSSTKRRGQQHVEKRRLQRSRNCLSKTATLDVNLTNSSDVRPSVEDWKPSSENPNELRTLLGLLTFHVWISYSSKKQVQNQEENAMPIISTCWSFKSCLTPQKTQFAESTKKPNQFLVKQSKIDFSIMNYLSFAK